MSKLAWKIVDCTMTTTRHTLLAAGLGGGGGGGESSAADVGLPSIEILKERKKEWKWQNLPKSFAPPGGWTPHIKGVAMLVGNLITRMITDRIGLHSVLLPLLIIIIKAKLCAKLLIWKLFFILMQMKLIIARKVLHLASFWKWEILKPGNGLLSSLPRLLLRAFASLART